MNINLKNRFLISSFIISVAIVIGALIFVSQKRTSYKECLKTWTPEWSDEIINEFLMTKEDFCEKGYSLSDFFSLSKTIADEIKQKHPTTFLRKDDEFDKLFGEKLKTIINP